MPKKQWIKSIASQWDLFFPPTRPSLSELAVIENYILKIIKENKNSKVAILGSTPEYRDLCLTYGVDYKCIDYSRSNFNELGEFMLHRDTERNLVIADWRVMDLKEKFDLFIGDHPTAVIPVKDHDKIFKNIKKHCNRGAKLILKIAWRGNNRRLTLDQIFKLYRERYYYLNPFAACWYQVVLADYNFQRDEMHCRESLKRLKESFQDRTITKHEYEEIRKRWEVLGDFRINIPLKHNFLKEISKYFKLDKITSGNDWYKKQCPILIFTA